MPVVSASSPSVLGLDEMRLAIVSLALEFAMSSMAAIQNSATDEMLKNV